MADTPWDVIILAKLTRMGFVGEMSRLYQPGSLETVTDVLKPSDANRNFYNLLYAIEYGDDSTPGRFVLDIRNQGLDISKLSVGSSVIKTGHSVFTEWSNENPLRIQVLNQTEATEGKLDLTFKYVQFKETAEYDAFERFLVNHYDHRVMFDKMSDVNDRLGDLVDALREAR